MPETRTEGRPARSRTTSLALTGVLLLGAVNAQGVPTPASADAQGTGLIAQAAPSGAVCPERDVHISVQNVGDAVAENLDTDGDTTVLSNACFIRNKLAVDTTTLRTSGGVSDATGVKVSGQDLRGTADSLHADQSGTSLSNFRARLRLPNPAFPDLPVSAGEYDLVSPSLKLGDTGSGNSDNYATSDLTLTNVQDGVVTRLTGAVSTQNRVTADSATINRIQAQRIDVQPNSIRAQQTRVGLCRDPRATGLALNAASLDATPTGTALTGGGIRAGFLTFPVNSTIDVTARGGTVADTVRNFQDSANTLIGGVQASPPNLLLADGVFEVGNIPLLDKFSTRVNFGVTSQFPVLGVTSNYLGTFYRLGFFDDYDGSTSHVLLPEASVVHLPNSGLQYLAALRGNGYLSEARVGYAQQFGPLNLRGEVGAGNQNDISTFLGHARAVLSRDVQVTPRFSVGGTLLGDVLYFPNQDPDHQAYVEGQVRAGYSSGPFTINASHVLRRVDGASVLHNEGAGQNLYNLLVTGDQYTVASANLNLFPGSTAAARLTSLGGYVYYDWDSHTFSSATVGLNGRIEGRYGLLTPRVQYDFLKGTPVIGTDALLYSDCFAYGVGLDYTLPYTQNSVSYPGSLSIGVRFNFR